MIIMLFGRIKVHFVIIMKNLEYLKYNEKAKIGI